MNRIIYITGPDGSGKTSYLKEIENYLKNRGEKPKHIWIRSPKILSKPLMVFCRLSGLTKYKSYNGIKYGIHEFYRSRIISWFYSYLQLFDFKLKWQFIKRSIGKEKIILFDRFALDTLADIMVDTHQFDLHKKYIGKKFIELIPNESEIIVLKINEDLIRERKIDTKYDLNLTIKIKVYDILSNELKLYSVSNNESFKVVKDVIFNHLELCERN